LIAEFDPSADTTVSAKGFPFSYPYGALSTGKITGVDSSGRLEAIEDNSFGHFFDPGFSGAPIFVGQGLEVTPGTAIGICATNDADGRGIARFISPAHLAQALRAVVSPYRWLAAFEIRDTPFYFGRESLVDALWRELRERRFLLLAGTSGSGKSSVLRAGLASRAGNAGYAVVRPMGDAKAELAAAFGLPRDAELTAIADAIERETNTRSLLLGLAEELVTGARLERTNEILEVFAEMRERLEGRLLLALCAR